MPQLNTILEKKELNELKPVCSSIILNLEHTLSIPSSDLLKKFKDGLSIALSEREIRSLKTVYTCPTSSFGTLFGENWEGHPFCNKSLFWHRNLLEPDATRLIGKVCSYNYCGSKKNQRILSFCIALQESISPSRNLLTIAEINENTALEMSCEYVVEKKRIDIVIHQQGDPESPFIVLEAKFDAPLNNDLEVYEKHAQKKQNCLCIILGCKDERTEKIKQRWHFAHWAEVLRYWELQLKKSKDIDEDFSRLRSSLWAKLVR